MKKAKVSFTAEMTCSFNHLNFELKRPDLDYPDHIGGEYYFSLSVKERKKYRLRNAEYVLKHSDYSMISNLTVNEQV